MWKKDSQDNYISDNGETRRENGGQVNQSETQEMSVLGSSLKITGKVEGSQDLLIQGCIEGEITLQENTVVVGRDGCVEANITARNIKVEGEVIGDIVGLEQVVVLDSGNVRGNIVAPRVTLQDGAKLKGSIDMDPDNGTLQKISSSSVTKEAEQTEEAETSTEEIYSSVLPNSSH